MSDSLSTEVDPDLARILKELRRAIVVDPSCGLESFLASHADVTANPVTAIELVYEDYCVRRELGVSISIESVFNRFPQWRRQLEVVFECDQLFLQRDSIAYPEIGESFADFQLHRELGRGARGRVYLATQPALSDRPVVLKLSPATGDEHRSLARLQHSAIVPLLFVQEDAECLLRTLGMPYFGGCTLDNAMRDMRDDDVADRRGQDFLTSIERFNYRLADDGAEPSIDRPAVRFLASANFQQAVCWIIACLADGLHYAHQRGLLHLDVKPSNVLLANDGQPMLLDFHLARERKSLGQGDIETLGGTPGYMAPEQYQAIRAARRAARSDVVIDERCDIYSLGLMMRDLLTGATPPSIDTRDESPIRDPQLMNDLSHVEDESLMHALGRCLAEPELRYRDASELAIDLRRIAFGATNANAQDRFWVGLLTGVALGGMLLIGGQFLIRRAQPSAPVVVTESSHEVIANQLHALMSQTRTGDVFESASAAELRQLEFTSQRIWDQRQVLIDEISQLGTSATSLRLSSDLQDLGTLLGNLIVHNANAREEAQTHQLADRVLQQRQRLKEASN